MELKEGTLFTPSFVTDINESEIEIKENKILIELNNDEISKGSIYFDFVKVEGEEPKRFQIGTGAYHEETYETTEDKRKEYLELTKLAPSVSFMQKALDTTVNEINNMFNQSFLFQNHGIGGLGIDSNNIIVNGAEIFNDYENNKALGQYSHAQGHNTKAFAACSHVEGDGTQSDVTYSGYRIIEPYGITDSNTDIVYLGFHLDDIKYENYSETLFNDEDIIWNIYTIEGEKYNDKNYTNFTFHRGNDGKLIVCDKQYLYNDYGPSINADLETMNLYLVCMMPNAGLNSTTIISSRKNKAVHVEGIGTIGSSEAQHIQGRYNIPNENFAFIIGNGTSNKNRSNAFAIDWNGNTYVESGMIYGKANGNLQLIGRSGNTLGNGGAIEFNHLMSDDKKKVMAFLDYENNNNEHIVTFYPGTYYKKIKNEAIENSPNLANLGNDACKWDNIYAENLYATNLYMPSGSSITLQGGFIKADSLNIKELVINNLGFKKNITKIFSNQFINPYESSNAEISINLNHEVNFQEHFKKIMNKFQLKLDNTITYLGIDTSSKNRKYENKISLYPYNDNSIEDSSGMYGHQLYNIIELGTSLHPWDMAYIGKIFPSTRNSGSTTQLGSQDKIWDSGYFNNLYCTEATLTKLIPPSTNTGCELGSPEAKWYDIYAVRLWVEALLPISNSLKELGYFNNPWSAVYANKFISHHATIEGTYNQTYLNLYPASNEYGLTLQYYAPATEIMLRPNKNDGSMSSCLGGNSYPFSALYVDNIYYQGKIFTIDDNGFVKAT